ncbi:MAG: M48 family metalloprotease [Candidatus Micrarchaeia archaeon]
MNGVRVATTGLSLRVLLTSTLVFGVVAGVLGVLLWSSGASGAEGVGLWLGVSLTFLFAQWWFGPALIRWSTGASEVSEHEAPRLHAMVGRLAALAGVPKPKLLVVRNPTPNAFAFGRTQASSYVAVHTGLLERLGEKEVEAVLAHEIGHIKHRDVLVMTVASALPVMLYYAFILFGGSLFGGRDREERGGFIAVWLGAVAAQFIGSLLVMFLSRTREYYADAFSAYATGEPLALASALAKITYFPVRAGAANAAVKALYIAEPGARGLSHELAAAIAHGDERALHEAIEKEKGHGAFELFMTHPPTWKRLEALMRIRGEIAA